MHPSRTCLMLHLLSLCTVALLLSLASAESALLGPGTSGDDKWPSDSPAGTPVAVALTFEAAEDKAALADVADGIAVPPGRHRFRPHHHTALSPEARRGLDHEARCGPRVPVRRGFPWSGRNRRCLGGDVATDGAATGARTVTVWPHIWYP